MIKVERRRCGGHERGRYEQENLQSSFLLYIILKKSWSIHKKSPLMWHLYLMIVRTAKTPSDAIVPNMDNTSDVVPKPDVGFLLIVLSCFFIFLTCLATMIEAMKTAIQITNSTILIVMSVSICALVI